MSEGSYTNAALAGYGNDSYTNAALAGYGDESYTTAALRGGRLPKGSAAAKARMALLRSMRTGAKAGKRTKGGSIVGKALSLIPLAFKGARLLYKGIKWLTGRNKGSGVIGGRALILDPKKRAKYIDELKAQHTGRTLSALWPYTLEKARKHYDSRLRRLPRSAKKYIEDSGVSMEDALFDTATMKQMIKNARAAEGLFDAPAEVYDGISYPSGTKDPKIAERRNYIKKLKKKRRGRKITVSDAPFVKQFEDSDEE